MLRFVFVVMFNINNIVMEAVCGGLDSFVVFRFNGYLTINGRVVWIVITSDCVSVWFGGGYGNFVFEFGDIDGICGCIVSKVGELVCDV